MTRERGAPPTSDDIGPRLRIARENAGLSMRALASICGVSQPFLSMVEHGRCTPSIATLYRIADALGTTPVALMPTPNGDRIRSDSQGTALIRSGEGRKLPVSEATNSAIGTILAASPGLEMIEYRIKPGDDLGEWFSSSGMQTLTVIEGCIRVEMEGSGICELSAGDTFTHPSHVPHRWLIDPTQGAHLILAVTR